MDQSQFMDRSLVPWIDNSPEIDNQFHGSITAQGLITSSMDQLQLIDPTLHVSPFLKGAWPRGEGRGQGWGRSGSDGARQGGAGPESGSHRRGRG